MANYRSAREFLLAVEARYRGLTGYSDRGFSQRLASHRRHVVTFKTAYLANDRFRFEFCSAHPYRKLGHLVSRDVVGTDGVGAYHYSIDYGGKPELERTESREMALAGATGISSGTAHTIGALLFEDVHGLRLAELRRPRFRQTRQFDGVPCLAVSGLHPWGRGRMTAWFGAEDLLLRRLLKHGMKSEELRFDVRACYLGGLEDFDAPRVDV